MGWLLPVGIPGGVNSGVDGIPAGSGLVRLGGKLIFLDLDHYRLWRAAAAAPSAEKLIGWGTDQGIPAVADRVRQLEEAGLLIADGPDLPGRIGQLALRLLGECLGNGPQISPAFVVLGRSRTQLQVNAYLFEILLHCDGVSPVSVTCDTLDAARSPAGGPPGIETLAESLPLLVRSEVVLLQAPVR